jgi:hypothetical protein
MLKDILRKSRWSPSRASAFVIVAGGMPSAASSGSSGSANEVSVPKIFAPPKSAISASSLLSSMFFMLRSPCATLRACMKSTPSLRLAIQPALTLTPFDSGSCASILVSHFSITRVWELAS